LLKKYKKQPEVQQQLKIAFADGYSYAEQKTSSEGDKKSGAASYLSYASDLIWWCIGLWVMFHVLSELRHSFSGGEGFSRNLFNSLGPYEVNPEDIAITFNDVKGVDEAKDELLDVVEFLRDPDRFSSLGGKMPHGVLLVGEPEWERRSLLKPSPERPVCPSFTPPDPSLTKFSSARVQNVFVSYSRLRKSALPQSFSLTKSIPSEGSEPPLPAIRTLIRRSICFSRKWTVLKRMRE